MRSFQYSVFCLLLKRVGDLYQGDFFQKFRMISVCTVSVTSAATGSGRGTCLRILSCVVAEGKTGAVALAGAPHGGTMTGGRQQF